MKKEVPLSNLCNKVNELPKKIICHPDNFDLIKKEIPPLEYPGNLLWGIEIVVDKNIPKYARRWQFPYSPFIEYEKSDEEWAIKLSYGRWIDTDEPVFYVIDWPIFSGFGLWGLNWKLPKNLLFTS